MIPLPWRLLGGAALLGVLLLFESHRIGAAEQRGVDKTKAAQHLVDLENDQLAKATLDGLNLRLAAAQASLALARAQVVKLELENQNEKISSDDLQRRLAAGEQRLRVLVRIAKADPAGPTQGAVAVRLDPGAPVEADLDGTVAANLEWIRSTRARAIERLDACIIEYDALKAAVDAIQ